MFIFHEQFSLERSVKGLGKLIRANTRILSLRRSEFVLIIDAHYYGFHGIASVEFINRVWPKEVLSHLAIKEIRNKILFEQKIGYRWLGSIEKHSPNVGMCRSK